jgi:hypothetical protein
MQALLVEIVEEQLLEFFSTLQPVLDQTPAGW